METEIALAGHGAWLQNGWAHWQGETGHGLVEESSNMETPLRPWQWKIPMVMFLFVNILKNELFRTVYWRSTVIQSEIVPSILWTFVLTRRTSQCC
jgi:hypothetical protein